jgi:ABC-type hemin transport system substrate-binding protein
MAAGKSSAIDISGTTASTVFALGLGENVVGRDISTGFADTGRSVASLSLRFAPAAPCGS